MHFIGNWVKNIVVMVMITTILEMMLPENNLRQCVRVVMGFFIIIIFLSPFSVILNRDLTDAHPLPSLPELDLDWSRVEEQGRRLEDSNRGLLRDYYRERLEKRLLTIIEMDFPDYDCDFEIDLNSEYQLKGVGIILRPGSVNRVNISSIDLNEGRDTQLKEEGKQRVLTLKTRIARALQLPLTMVRVQFEE